MRLRVTSGNPIEWLAIRFGVVPEPLVLGFWGMSASRVLLTATKLGVFEALEAGPMSAEELAQKLECDPEGIEVLLDALNGFRYVRRRDGRYRLATSAKRWIARSSKLSMADTLLFYDDLWDVLGNMTKRVRSGDTSNMHYEDRDAEFWDHYLRGLASFARMVGPMVAKTAPPAPGAKRLLDVGGGHGLYALAYAQRYPELSAEVLDLPGACAVGRELVEESGSGASVTFREGDARTTEWGDGYDAVLLFNLIHNLTAEEAAEVLARAHRSLNPGGRVIVLEGEHSGGPGDLSTTAGMDELLFYLTSGTRTYPEATMRAWMRDAGFDVARPKRLVALPLVVLTGTRR